MGEFAFVLNIPVCVRLTTWRLVSCDPRAVDLNLDARPYRGNIHASQRCLHSTIAAKPQ